MPQDDLGLVVNDIVSLTKSGTGAPGTVDTYTFTLRNGKTFSFQVTNGANGSTGGVEKHEFTTVSDFTDWYLAIDLSMLISVAFFDADYNSMLCYIDNAGSGTKLYKTLPNGNMQELVALSSGEKIVAFLKVDETQEFVPATREIAGIGLGSDIPTNAIFDKTNIKGRYATLSALQTADPNHGYCYLIEENNHWYYWNGAAWTDGGVYQATVIGADSVGVKELKNEVLASLNNKYAKNAVFALDVLNSYVNNSGGISSASTNRRTDYVYIKGYKALSFNTHAANISNLAFFTKDKTYIGAISLVNTASGTIDLTDAQYDTAYYAIVSTFNPDGQEYLQLIADGISKFDVDFDLVKQLYPTNLKAKSVPYEFDGLIKYGDGTIDTSHSGFRTALTDISFVKKIYWKATGSVASSDFCYIAFYDKNEKYIQSLSVRGGAPNFYGAIDLTQSGYPQARYVMCSCYASDTGDAYRNQCGLLLEEFNEYELDNFSKNAYEEINETTKWKVKTIRFSTQGNINNVTGALENTSSTDRKCIDDYISIKGYSKMIVSSFFNPNILMLYDKNKRLVKTYTLTELDANNKYIFEFDLDNDEQFEGVEYVRANLWYGSNVYNEKDFYVRLIAKNTEKPLGKFSDKNILIFGDSITDTCDFTINSDNQTTKYTFRRYTQGTYNNRTMWPYIFNEMYALKEMRNYARSSATWQITDRTEDRINAVSQVTIALNDKDNPNGVFNQSVFNPDIIVFALGVNDGTPDDTYEEAMNKTIYVSGTNNIDVDATLANLDKTKFNQAIRWCLLTVKKEWPSAQVFVSLAISRGTGNSNYLSAINNDITKMAQRCGCIVINSALESGIVPEGNSNGAGQTLADGLHPNDLGCKMLARCIISKIDSCYMDIGEMGEN